MYGKEMRLKVLELLETGTPLKEISAFLSIHPKTIQNWIRHLKTQGTIEPKTHGLRRRKIDKEQLRSYINNNPDKTLKEIGSVFGVSIPAIFKSLKKMSITLKKIIGYKERDEEKREEFIKEIQQIPKEFLLYMDEAGLDNRLYRPYARSLRGVKVHARLPGKKRERISMIGGWILNRFIAPMSFQGGCNNEVLNAWLQEVLLPQLKTGTTIVMDNAAFHKTKKTKEIIEEAGCFLKFLPTYSPDLNPIEHCWHSLKSALKPLIQGPYENLHELVDKALFDLLQNENY